MTRDCTRASSCFFCCAARWSRRRSEEYLKTTQRTLFFLKQLSNSFLKILPTVASFERVGTTTALLDCNTFCARVRIVVPENQPLWRHVAARASVISKTNGTTQRTLFFKKAAVGFLKRVWIPTNTTKPWLCCIFWTRVGTTTTLDANAPNKPEPLWWHTQSRFSRASVSALDGLVVFRKKSLMKAICICDQKVLISEHPETLNVKHHSNISKSRFAPHCEKKNTYS